MSYQVIARKYRPQTFSDLTGQEHIAQTLINSLEKKRLHHAYMFSGVRGTGKTTTARILAKGLNCIDGITSTPCLTCASCLEIAAGNSIDVQEIDAASYTGVDNVREVIINSLAIGPARDRYKVFIIDEVHMLSTHAFNALLKTLEEPPSHVVFVMATTALHKVPETILSRCQQFEFRQIPTEKIFRRLRQIADAEGTSIDETALREIARAGAGSLRDAQSAFDQVIAFSGSVIRDEDVYSALGLVGTSLLERTTLAISAQDARGLLDTVEELASRGYDLRSFTTELMSWLRNLLLIKSGIDRAEALGVTDTEVKRLKDLAEDFSEEDLVRGFHLLTEVEKEIKDSPLPRFSLEVGLLKLVHMIKLAPISELISRLEAIESEMKGGPSPPNTDSAPSVTARPPVSRSAKPTAPEPQKRATMQRSVESAPAVRSAPTRSPGHSFVPEEPPGLGDFDIPSDLDEPMAIAPAEVPPVTRDSQRAPEVDAISAEIEKRGRGLLSTAIDEAREVEYRDGVLTVTFASNDVWASRVRDSQSLLREVGEHLFKQPMRVEVVIAGNGVATVDKEKEARDALRERALKSPAVKLFIEGFQGEIVDIKENPPKRI